MRDDIKSPIQSPTIADVVKPAMDQCTHELRQAIRNEFIKRQIPLNTRFEIRTVSDLEDLDIPVQREVWVFQVFPVKRIFKLMNVEQKVVMNRLGAAIQQTITPV